MWKRKHTQKRNQHKQENRKNKTAHNNITKQTND